MALKVILTVMSEIASEINKTTVEDRGRWKLSVPRGKAEEVSSE